MGDHGIYSLAIVLSIVERNKVYPLCSQAEETPKRLLLCPLSWKETTKMKSYVITGSTSASTIQEDLAAQGFPYQSTELRGNLTASIGLCYTTLSTILSTKIESRLHLGSGSGQSIVHS
ncbi:hypothetical protein RHGRI_025946 [Rhododendron griersonianum]|uniref:Uncharacterized protein n=1 Tax=Rhododendron griersonianum TaxID=479676 RepID=A0AAV6IQZ1_9ERIC|nr:hypothetical protein RHGRI_025946 [Rhododendron griersonianum]